MDFDISRSQPKRDQNSVRLISPYLLFMQIGRLCNEGNYAIVGQVMNVPIDVNNIVQKL